MKCRGSVRRACSTLYTILPNNLMKEKLLYLIQWTFKRALKTMVHFIWHVMTERLPLLSCQNVCDALSYLLDNIYIRFGTKLYRQTVGIPMGTNCAPLEANLFCTVTKDFSWILLTMIINLMYRCFLFDFQTPR